MGDIMKYTLQQLKDSFNYVGNYLKSQGIEEIELSQDWYWSIGVPEKFNFSDIPTTDNNAITVGSLSDDIEILDRFIADDIALHCNLSRLASILEYLDYYIGKENQL